MATDFEVIVVGGGVVGLAIAYELGRAGRNVLVIERHGVIGSETSSRNSEVIHAGLYYPTGSLKALLCVKGKNSLYRFAADNGVAHRQVGKILVATRDSEIPQLAKIREQANDNGVTDLLSLTTADAKAIEPKINCAAALLSPSTGIIDSHELMASFEGHIAESGGEVVLNSTVDRADVLDGGNFRLEVSSPAESTSITCQKLIIAGGLHSTKLARSLHRNGDGAPSYKVPETYYAKGHYFSLSGRAPFRHLVYPMPDNGGLGIHMTLDMQGTARFGPDVKWQDDLDYAFDNDDGRLAANFHRQVRRYWPDLPDGALHEDYTGIRPKLAKEGEASADFAIHDASRHGVEGLATLFGIESPGLTACLAIAEYVAARL